MLPIICFCPFLFFKFEANLVGSAVTEILSFRWTDRHHSTLNYKSYVLIAYCIFLAIFTAPVLGRWSDKCTSPYGRRRPFLVIMSVLVIFSLALLYFGQVNIFFTVFGNFAEIGHKQFFCIIET